VSAELERDLQEIFNKLNVGYEIDVYFDGDELFRKMASGAHYDLIYLDIEFTRSEINGVEVGRLIREAHNNNIVSIVYISWEQKYSMQLFEIRPMNFLVKPLAYDKVEHTVKTYLKISGNLSGELIYKKGHDTFKVSIKDIIYLENYKKKVIIHFADGGKEEFYGSLKNACNEQLSKFDFLFIHASYVVNYDYVTSVKYNQLLLTDRITPLPISPNRRDEVRENYLSIMARRRI
jgi:DNA-binding LytR/AlgR family response regulator